MSDSITFINKPVITTFSPYVGFTGNTFNISGENLLDVEHVYFIDVFGEKTEVTFSTFENLVNNTIMLTGQVPMLDGTIGKYVVRVENALGYDDYCCFEHWVSTQTNIQNISGDDITQIDDKYSINAEINNTPTNTQGFEIMSLSYDPIGPTNKIIIQAEVSLQSSFWGAGVLALFKNWETTPKKVWNYSLLGLNFGQVAKIGFVADAGSTNTQTWRLRVGRVAGTFPVIYINRNSNTSIPYSGATSSWMSVTEIDN
jgi:hypothetical protein